MTIIGKGNKPIKTQPEYQEDTAYLRNIVNMQRRSC
jgi:hypothetical protein